MPTDPTDLVVCLPRDLFHDWLDEGAWPSFPEPGLEFSWEIGRRPPATIELNESRLYIVCNEFLRGYAPIRRVE